MSWPDGERYLHSLQFLVVSLFLCLVSILLFSRTVGVRSHLSSSTHRFPRGICALSSVRCNGHSLLLSSISLGLAELRIPAAPADARPKTPLISFCTVQLRTLCATYSLVTFCFFTTSGPDSGEFSGCWGSMVFHHAPIPRKRSGNEQQQEEIPDIVVVLPVH